MKRFLSVLAVILVVAISGFVSIAAKTPADNDGRVHLNEANTLVLRGQVNDTSVSKLIKELELRQGQDLYLYIYSPGGDIMAGQHLIEAMRTFNGHVTCIADVAISMAFSIYEACEHRLTFPTGMLMQHEASYGIRGDAPHNFSYVTFLHHILRRLDEAQAKRIGLPYDEFKKRTGVDWWMDGTDAVANHVADEFAQVTCTKALTEKKVTETIQVMIFSAEIEWSGCPLLHAPNKVNIKPSDGGTPDEADKAGHEYVNAIVNVTDGLNYEKAMNGLERVR